MYKLFGSLVIVNAVIIATWWLMGEHPHKGWAFTLCLTAIFGGTILIFNERITEVTVKGVGTIKAAAEKAQQDVNEISAIKERIEAQSATVDIVAQKANTTISQLHEIALSSAETTLTDLMAANFMGGTTLETKLNLHDKIVDSLKDIGISDDDIAKVNEMWSKGVMLIYQRGIRYALEERTNPNMINSDAIPELLQASKEFNNLGDFENWEAPSPDEIESFIEKRGYMNDKVKALIEDYRHFITTGKIQRRDVFINL